MSRTATSLSSESDGELQHVLLRATQPLIRQIEQTALCNRHHAVEQ